MSAVTEEQLRIGGGRREMFAVYCGIASGRIVLTGGPGAGKTGTAVLLLLDVLNYRASLDGPDRDRVPVPVLLSVRGWDPSTCAAGDWLADRLTADYPLFQGRSGQAEVTAMITSGTIALILDGLDEMPAVLRPAALAALSDAPFRVMVLTRSQEMIQATGETWLAAAVAVHLLDVTGSEAADYLEWASTGPPPTGWPQLLAHLREQADGALAWGLSTPLALSLLRDTYRAGDDVTELLDTTLYRTGDEIEQHLIARVLPAAYTPRPGRPPPRYTLAQAQQGLTFLARQMNNDHTRDLVWWHIPRWAPANPRLFTTALIYIIICGLTFGLAASHFLKLPALWPGLITGLFAGFLGASITRFAKPRRLKDWRAVRWGPLLTRAFAVWLVTGFAVGLAVGFITQFRFGLASGPWVGLTAANAQLHSGLAEDLTQGEDSPLSPEARWRNDRIGGLVFVLPVVLTSGITLGCVIGLTGSPAVGLAGSLAFGFLVSFAIGLVAGLTTPQTWPTTLAWFQLQRSRRVPAVGMMPFLEDARAQGVLRNVGVAYQFMHANLQDHLASVITSTPGTPLTGWHQS